MGLKSILMGITNAFLDYILKPILKFSWRFYYRDLDHLEPLTVTRKPLLFMPAWKIAKKIRKREVTCLEVVQTFIDRIKEVQPLLNFMVYDCFDEAIELAKKYDEILSSASIPEEYSEENAPLLGVPFTCKESLWVKGKPNSTGVLKRKDFRAPEDAYVVQYMRKSGAIMLCLTNTSELCYWFESSNYLYGTTRNPYNLSRIVGGSSGGEGCAIGSGASIFGLGSDIGGSIRIPSYFNGVYGHMTTPNTVISNDWQYPTGLQQCMLSTGPICRYATDLRPLFKILCGPKYSEISHKFESEVDVNKLKFYVIRGMQGHPLVTELDADAKKALDKAVLFIEDKLGRPVQELKPKKLKYAFEMWSSLVNEGNIGKKSFCKLLNSSEDEPINALKELFKAICGRQKEHTLPSILIGCKEQLGIYEPEKFIEVGNEFRQEMQEILGEDGVLIFPSFPTVAPYHNISAFIYNFDFLYFGVMNMLGFPVTQCPMGLSSQGLPTGVQVVANRLNDHLTIKMAEIFEAQIGGWVHPF